MFGYLRPSPLSLDYPSYRQYQGVYCALCRTLGRRYGPLARMMLNYDLAFFSLLRLATGPTVPSFSECRCPFSPFCRRLCCDEENALNEAADATVLLTWQKLCDNVADSRGLKRLAYRLLQPVFRPLYRKAAARREAMAQRLETYMAEQATLEQSGCTSVDAAADPFARFLSDLLGGSEADTPLRPFGYHLGRWIYLADAVDDLSADIKEHRYNPFSAANGLVPGTDPAVCQTIRKNACRTLNACQAACKAAYDALPVSRFDPIFRNILYAGMPGIQQDLLLSPKEKRVAARKYARLWKRKKRDL